MKIVSWEIEMHYANEEITKYNDAIWKICKSGKLKFIDIFSDFKNNNFKETLYPKENFAYDEFIKKVNSDKYLQINFDYKRDSLSIGELWKEYNNLINIFR